MNKILIVVFSILCPVLLYGAAGTVFSERVFISSTVIQIFSLYHIFSYPTRVYSLKKIFYLFSLFFFGISPLLQFYANSSFFGSRVLSEAEYFYINILIVVIFLIFELSYRIFDKISIRKFLLKFSQKYYIKTPLKPRQNITLIIFSILSFALIFYANNFNINSMLIRSGDLKESKLEDNTISLIIYRFFQPLSMVCLFYFVSSKAKNYFVLFILSFFALLTCFPTSMARFSVAALYLPLAILTLGIFKYKNIFSLFFVSCLLVLFPFLNQFRGFSSDTAIEIGFDFNMYTEGHFDSYHNFAIIIAENIVTYGRQLLGVLLFWVPRSVWPDKPIGSGAFLANKLNFFFDNVSANFFAEGYLNFGFFGIAIFAIFLGATIAQLDKLYWGLIVKQQFNFFKIFYLVMLSMLFFMLRGDLLSSFAYTMGFVFAIITVYKFANKT